MSDSGETQMDEDDYQESWDELQKQLLKYNKQEINRWYEILIRLSAITNFPSDINQEIAEYSFGKAINCLNQECDDLIIMVRTKYGEYAAASGCEDTMSEGYFCDPCYAKCEWSYTCSLVDNALGVTCILPGNPANKICFRCKKEIHPNCEGIEKCKHCESVQCGICKHEWLRIALAFTLSLQWECDDCRGKQITKQLNDDCDEDEM